MSGGAIDRRAVAVLVGGAFCLALQGALKAHQIPNPVPRLGPVDPDLVLAYLLVPAAFLALLGERPLGYFVPRRFREVRVVVLVLLALALVTALALALLPNFQRYYGGWGEEPLSMLALRILGDMLCVEFLFRGFLVIPLYRVLGNYALLVALMPYTMIHIGKPLLELFGSVLFGFALSGVSARSGSILYGLAVHWLLAFSHPLAVSVLR